MEKTKRIELSSPVESTATKTRYEYIDLKEPVLLQVQQWYDEQQKAGVLRSMGLLITLVSGMPPDAVNKMSFTDYKQCEAYLMGFLMYSPSQLGGENS